MTQSRTSMAAGTLALRMLPNGTVIHLRKTDDGWLATASFGETTVMHTANGLTGALKVGPKLAYALSFTEQEIDTAIAQLPNLNGEQRQAVHKRFAKGKT